MDQKFHGTYYRAGTWYFMKQNANQKECNQWFEREKTLFLAEILQL